MTSESPYVLVGQMLYERINDTRGPASVLTQMAQQEAESDPQVTHVAVAYKAIEGLLDLARYMIEIPSIDKPIEEALNVAANYCQSIQLMLVSLREAVGGRGQESQDAAILAVQIISEMGLLEG